MKNAFVSLALATVAAIASPTIAQAAIISFDDLPGADMDAFTGSHSEGGFNLTLTSGNAFVGLGLGNPLPSLFFDARSGEGTSTLLITRIGGGEFTFDGFDFNAQGDFGQYSFEGLLGGKSVFSASGSQFPNDLFIPRMGGAGEIDELLLTLTPTGTSVSIDNIRVDEVVTAAVPEPSTWAMLIAGFGMMGFVMRRGHRRRVRLQYS